jgi:hypothetical protein
MLVLFAQHSANARNILKEKTSYRVLQNDSRRSKHGKQAASRAAVVRLLLTLSSIDSHPRFSLVVAR